ncbi:MAG TPA: hypothetical protein VFS53_04210 [Gemmatimonadota bacterium]|nr:hypothetical protein [Gemmatimonadota bacterium]
MPQILKPSLNWLLPLTPIAIAVRFLAPEAHVWVFFLAGVAIIPIAGWMGGQRSTWPPERARGSAGS